MATIFLFLTILAVIALVVMALAWFHLLKTLRAHPLVALTYKLPIRMIAVPTIATLWLIARAFA